MKKLNVYLIIATLIVFAIVKLNNKGEDSNNNSSYNTATTGFNYHQFKPSSTSKVYDKSYYSLEYNEKHEQANWVYYLLTKKYVKGHAKRKNEFLIDRDINTGSATLKDYRRSGYSRGHLCAAADMKQNDKAIYETFYMSNMSPQLGSFNAGEWNRLEMKVRRWAVQEDSIIVVTGPVFKNNKGSIGRNKVTVPGAYYKVLYDLTKPQKMTAFIIPHMNNPKHYKNYQTTVNEVEKQTGIDFFPILDDKMEERLEGNPNW